MAGSIPVLILASVHHVLFLGLIVMMATQLALLRVKPVPVVRLAELDQGYGLTAGLILIVGLARILHAEKGWAYYQSNPFFWGKMAAFGLIALLSIVPTVSYLGWRKQLAHDPVWQPRGTDIRRAHGIVVIEMVLVGAIMIMAAGMARWPL